MEREDNSKAEGPANASTSMRGSSLWYLGVLGLLAWQGWMTLTLFGREAAWDNLLSEQPIVDGRHGLRLYHGLEGARAFWSTGGLCAYDPAFQAGYPLTPVFDSGSRPAQLFLVLADGGLPAYKIGLACCCLLAPCLILLAGLSAGLGRAGSLVATALALVVWWSVPGRKALDAGDLDLLLAALALMAYVGLLVRFDRAPGVGCWLGLFVSASLACFAQPVLFALLLPLMLVYYLTSGVRHREMTWHLGLLATVVGAVTLNAFWLLDWLQYWWIRAPSPLPTGMLAHRTFRTLWESTLWGGPADRDLAIFLVASALVGVLILNQAHQRVAARLLGLGGGGLCLLAVLGIAWEPLSRAGTDALLVPGLLFAALPAGFAWTWAVHFLYRKTGQVALTGLICLGMAVSGAAAARHTVVPLAERCAGTTPLTIGLGSERQAIVATLIEHTRPDARILWEDRRETAERSGWTALLPLLTERAFVGGLEPRAAIEHLHVGLIEQKLAGQPIGTTSDAALADYCRRYNIGWVVAWSPEVIARFRAWNEGVDEIARLVDGGEGVLLALRRPTRSFALKGQAQLLHADSRRITLANVVPEDGKVVLSFHYQTGLRASPSRVRIEREPDPATPIALIRLRLSGPVARLTLTWDER
jgi:hypothetical protein